MKFKESAYSRKLQDPRWQKLRLQVFERDGWACRGCGDADSMLNAHHTYYTNGAAPWDYPPESIVTLCGECHESEHANWECGEIRDALGANGFWSVYMREILAQAITGHPGSRPLTKDEAWGLIGVIEKYGLSCRERPAVKQEG
jgi:5-methylcytosine-specific restriction enzyme A